MPLAPGGALAPALLAHPEWTPEPGEVVLVADWGARRDGEGRTMFTAWWWTDYIPGVDGPAVRGQVFVARPEKHAEKWEADGYVVRVEQAVSEPQRRVGRVAVVS